MAVLVTVRKEVDSFREANQFALLFEDFTIGNVTIAPTYDNDKFSVEVTFAAASIESCECADHMTQPYPTDLLLPSHTHD